MVSQTLMKKFDPVVFFVFWCPLAEDSRRVKLRACQHRVHYMPFLAYSQSHVTDKLAGSIVSSRSVTVPIKSIRRSQVTGLLDLTKGHSGHRSQMELTNSFFGPLKWLPKAPKVQKSPPARFRQ